MTEPIDKHTAKQLLERFFDGETTLQEEQWLYEYFDGEDADEELMPYREMFRDLKAVYTHCKDFPADTSVTPVKAKPKTGSTRPVITLLRVAAGIAAAVLMAFAVRAAWEWHEDRQLASLYGGSYVIVNGNRIDDLSRIRTRIDSTLNRADRIEQRVKSHNVIDAAEQSVLEKMDNPEERQEIMNMLN